MFYRAVFFDLILKVLVVSPARSTAEMWMNTSFSPVCG
jgi:hypothetical protein